MCDGKAASDCDIINLTEYESTLNDQLVKLDEHFNEINEQLKRKKEAFVKMYRKDPRISRDEEIFSLKRMIEDFNTMNEQEIPALETDEGQVARDCSSLMSKIKQATEFQNQHSPLFDTRRVSNYYTFNS